MTPLPDRTALVLAAHGSLLDAAACEMVRRHAARIRARGLFDEVAAAFHQGDPGFDQVLDRLEARKITVVPFLTSDGYFADVVLPARLRENRRYDEVRLGITGPIGTHRAVPRLLRRRAARLLRAHGLAPGETTIVVAGHGTRRHSRSREATLALARSLGRGALCAEALAAFLDDDPSLEEIADRTGGRPLLVLPFLIGGAAHATRDLPRAFGLDGAGKAAPPFLGAAGNRKILIDAPFGEHPAAADIALDLARPGLPASRRERAPVARRLGLVQLVGAGPGDPDLITVKGRDALRLADVVVHDRLAAPALLNAAPRHARRIDLGKSPGDAPFTQEAINAVLVTEARAGRRVVRLKGGDPFVFGRGAEEAAACRDAGVRCEVIPGVSSALAAPAAAGIPVTARGIGRSFAVVTARTAPAGPAVDVGGLAGVDTIVILMGMSRIEAITRDLVAAGRSPATPAACVQQATTPEQRSVVATLETLAREVKAAGLEAPGVIVVGEVAGLASAVDPGPRALPVPTLAVS